MWGHEVRSKQPIDFQMVALAGLEKQHVNLEVLPAFQRLLVFTNPENPAYNSEPN